jgi:glutamate dehydrogenase (NADP+)
MTLFFLACFKACINHSNRHHVDNVAHGTIHVQDMDRLVQPHLDRADCFTHPYFKHQLVGNICRIQLGGKAVTLSDSDGFIYDPDGFDAEKLNFVLELKNVKRGRIKEYAEKYKKAEYHAGKTPWGVQCDIAMPCATQNELNENDARMLVRNKCIAVSEGANMPSTPEAISAFQESKLLYGPGKAANAGGVATSGLETSQNSMRINWSRDEVDARLHQIMIDIHEACVKYGRESKEYVNYVNGANISGFIKIADAMIAQGAV